MARHKKLQQRSGGAFNLPYDIFPGKDLSLEPIIIYEYAAHAGTFKGKSVLHKNAISLVIEGRKTIHFAEKKVEIFDDEFHFLSSGNCLASIDLSHQHIFRSILIFFDDNTLADFYIKYDHIIKGIKKSKERMPYVSIRKDSFVRSFIVALQQLLAAGNISRAMSKLKWEELMLYLLEHHPGKVLSFYNAPKDFDDLAIRRAVETNITSNISVEELAFLCSLGLSTFKRRFAKIYGTSPAKWLLQRRMEIALNLLRRKHKPAEIFSEVGYENHSSFSKAFRQTYGIAPSEFRVRKLNV